MFSTSIFVNIISMFTSVYIARVFAPEKYGEYGVLLSIIAVFQSIASLGLPSILTREIARNQEHSRFYYVAARTMANWGCLLAWVLATAFGLIFYAVPVTQLVLILLIIWMNNVWAILQSTAYGMQRMEFNGMINLATTLVLMLVYVAIPRRFISIDCVLLVSLICLTLKNIVYYFVCRRQKIFTGAVPEAREVRKKGRWMIYASYSFLVMGLFSMLTTQVPVFFLSTNSSAEEVGYFNTANKLLLPLVLFVSTLSTAIFPNLSQLYVNDRVRYVQKLKLVFSTIAFLGILSCFFLSLFRSEIVALIYGEAYKNTGLVMAYQCWFMLAHVMFCFFGGIFTSSDNQKLLMYLSIAYACVNVPILWIGSYFDAQILSLCYVIGAAINISYHWYFMEKVLDFAISRKFTILLFGSILLFMGLSLVIPEHLNIGFKIAGAFTILGLSVLVLRKKIKATVDEILNRRPSAN